MNSKLIDDLNSFSNHPKWNKFPYLEIKRIEFNANKSLITFATNTGFRVYDSKTFKLLSSLDGNQEMIGPITKASVLYLSSIICFLGSDHNNYYKSNQVFFWNDTIKRTIGLIDFHERVFNFFLTKYMIFFSLWNKIYIFELKSLKYIYKINRVDIDENLISIQENYNSNKRIITLAYIPTLYNQENVINLVSYWINDQFQVSHYIKRGITTNFNNIKNICLQGKEKIIVVNDLGNKIHIYHTIDNELLYCIYMGNHKLKVSNFSFDIKEKFMVCLCDMDEIDIFKLKNIDNDKYKCTCNNHPDEKIKIKRKNSSNSFLGGYFNRLFNDSTVPFIYDNIHQYSDFYVCTFDNEKKNEIILINNYGIAFRYKFNRIKEKEPLKLIKEEILFDEDDY
jgi:hypothetical protein